MKLAPIGIMTYSRIDHLTKTINSLKENPLSCESDLYVFLDAPKPGDESKVGIVRQYIRTIDGFKNVTLIERTHNSRLENGVRAITQLRTEFDKYIFMEDDNIVAPGFLDYMNQALDVYRDDESVFAVGGHTPNLKSADSQKHDVYFTKRFNGWGYGMWSHKDIGYRYLPSHHDILSDKSFIREVNKYGSDILKTMIMDSKGIIDAGDVKYIYHMVKSNNYMVLPTRTLVRNIGLDGSGVHSIKHDVFSNQELSNKKDFHLERLYLSESIERECKNFFERYYLSARVVGKIRRLTSSLSRFL